MILSRSVQNALNRAREKAMRGETPMNETAMMVEMTAAKGFVPVEGTLEEKIKAAMKAVKNRREGMMGWATTDDELFRIAVGAVLISVPVDSEEFRLLDHSVKALTKLNAALQAAQKGIRIDWESVTPEPGTIIPILKWWQEVEVTK